MTIAMLQEGRTFVRENAPGMCCSYPISATGAAGTPLFDNDVINNDYIDKGIIEI